MSDGPHKSLNMGKGWRLVAERADRKAYGAEEIGEALIPALVRDWNETPLEVIANLQRLFLERRQVSFLQESVSEQADALRTMTAGYTFAAILIDCAIEVEREGLVGHAGLQEAAKRALDERAFRGGRQVEEHYFRNTDETRAGGIRNRIERGFEHCSTWTLAGQLLGYGGATSTLRIQKQTGLDDGVQL